MCVVMYLFHVNLLMGLTLERKVGFFHLNWTVSFSRGSSALFSSRLSWLVATLFQSTEENSIRDLVIARTKTASSGSSNGTLQKENASPLPEHFQTTSELIHKTHSLENESSSHDDTKEGGFKNFKFSEDFLLPNLRKQNKMKKGQSHEILFEKNNI